MKKIIMFLFVIVLLMSGVIINKLSKNMKNGKNYYDNLIGLDTPDNSKVIKLTDDSGGFHGDGDYYVVIQLEMDSLKDFSDKALKTGKWRKLPMNDEMNSFMYGLESKDGTYQYCGHSKGVPSNIKNGVYYFRDKYVETYPKEKDTSILYRPSHNFIFSILDFDTGKLYILESDS